MLANLRLLHLSTEAQLSSAEADLFVLRTCQRTLVLGFGDRPIAALAALKEHQYLIEDLQGPKAYGFLLETICGLKSKVLGEYEIVAQFKQAYADYVQLENRLPAIMQVLEKLFQDAKTVRSRHLLEISSLTYGALARKLLIRHCPEQKGRVLIMGSGKLAENTLKLLTRRFDVYLSARNFNRVAQLHDAYGIRPVEWFSDSLYREFAFIVNTIGTEQTLYQQEFFDTWSSRHEAGQRAFIDLGSPSSLRSHFSIEHGLYRLDDVFRFQEELDEQKRAKLAEAQAAIEDLVDLRSNAIKTLIRPKDLELA